MNVDHRPVPNTVDITDEGKLSAAKASSLKLSLDTGGKLARKNKTPDHMKPPPRPHLVLRALYFVSRMFRNMLELVVGMMKFICSELMATLTVGSWTSRMVEISELYAQSPEGPTPRQSMDTHSHVQKALKPESAGTSGRENVIQDTLLSDFMVGDSEEESEGFSQELAGVHHTSSTSALVADQGQTQVKVGTFNLNIFSLRWIDSK